MLSRAQGQAFVRLSHSSDWQFQPLSVVHRALSAFVMRTGEVSRFKAVFWVLKVVSGIYNLVKAGSFYSNNFSAKERPCHLVVA